jgi:threonyl-tRNA synthetase
MVIGGKEAENKTVSVRRLGSEKTETFKIDEILKALCKESLLPNSKEQS